MIKPYLMYYTIKLSLILLKFCRNKRKKGELKSKNQLHFLELVMISSLWRMCSELSFIPKEGKVCTVKSPCLLERDFSLTFLYKARANTIDPDAKSVLCTHMSGANQSVSTD